jgi:[CysO sulfur-carrier protein]-S-L-cysteine hydrolase
MPGEAIGVPATVLAEVYAHAREGWPEEVCGLLIGPPAAQGNAPSGAVDEVRRCVNVQNQLHAEDPVTFPRDARTAYNLGARDLFFVQKSLASERPAKIIYHSHVDVGAYFSDEDKRAALAGGDEPAYPVQFLVVDVRSDGVRGAKQFAWRAGQFVEVAEYGSIAK